MRVNAISGSYQNYGVNRAKISRQVKSSTIGSVNNRIGSVDNNVAFKAKFGNTLACSGIFATLGAIGAVGGIAIMTGGLGLAALPAIAAYSTACAGAGAVVGRMADKMEEDDEKKKKNKNNNNNP